MMYLSLKGDIFHIVADESGRLSKDKFYKTFCGKSYRLSRSKIFTTLGSYVIINNMCHKCTDRYLNSIVHSYNMEDLRSFKSNQYWYYHLLDYINNNVIGPKIKYERFLNKRTHPFTSKLRSK